MLDLRETEGAGNLCRSFYAEHRDNQIKRAVLEDRGSLHSSYNGLRNLKGRKRLPE